MRASGQARRGAARVTYTLPSSDTSPGWARYLTDAYLSHDRTGDVGREQIEDARIVVSELVTNATRHGSGNCLLRLTVRQGCVTVEVHDDSPAPPVLRELRVDSPLLAPESPEAVPESGRGIAMVRGLSRHFSVCRSPEDGKTVQAVLRD
ncbi:ATP-binding protein [Streptomyces fuscigenes]|uniref:ATP-binding protein n=1 Tax=Streptomyces fuscigenes TaxID=1528880 RepID=UPI001F1DCAC4|nr:ATP-binding protein [Streptomyces fuscigenes]MCF3965159.1 ATP-binding protein [Streptomyces fuscigenes]